MSGTHQDNAGLAYTRRVLPMVAIYLGLLVAVPFAIHWLRPSGPALWLLSLVPAVPWSAVFWLYGRYLMEERDEYLRSVAVRDSLIATGLVMSAATAWGFLQDFAGAPSMPLYAVPIAWFPCLGIASLVTKLADRRGNR